MHRRGCLARTAEGYSHRPSTRMNSSLFYSLSLGHGKSHQHPLHSPVAETEKCGSDVIREDCGVNWVFHPSTHCRSPRYRMRRSAPVRHLVIAVNDLIDC